MSVEKVVQSRINDLKSSIEFYRKNPLAEQSVAQMEEQLHYLAGILVEAEQPKMETEIRVQLTLSVDAKDDIETLVPRITALLESSGQMDVMEIKIKEESEIYSDD